MGQIADGNIFDFMGAVCVTFKTSFYKSYEWCYIYFSNKTGRLGGFRRVLPFAHKWYYGVMSAKLRPDHHLLCRLYKKDLCDIISVAGCLSYRIRRREKVIRRETNIIIFWPFSEDIRIALNGPDGSFCIVWSCKVIPWQRKAQTFTT